MNNKDKIRFLIREIISIITDEKGVVLNEGAAHVAMTDVLNTGRLKKLMHKLDRGAPHSFGITKKLMANYVYKKEEHIAEELRGFIFNDKVTIQHTKLKNDDSEIEVKLSGKTILTINLFANRLKASFIRFDFTSPPLKIKIPVNIDISEINNILYKHRSLFEDAGLNYLLKI